MKNNIKGKVRFSSVDVLAFMEQVVKRHMECYQSDFEIDKETLLEAADNQEQQDKTFLWLCRTRGTWCLKERDVFIKDTREYNTFKFYKEQTTEPILVFVIEVISAVEHSIIGNIYCIDYATYYHHVLMVSLPTKSILFQYEYDFRIKEAEAILHSYPDAEYGKFLSIQHQPHSQEELKSVLWREQQERKRLVEGEQHEYLAKL